MMRLNRRLSTGSMPDGERRIIEQARLAPTVAETALSALTGGMSGLPGGTVTGGVSPPGLQGELLNDFLPNNPVMRRRIFREMYYNDPIVGMGVDLLSTFPFSDFTLTGVNDETRLKKFAAAVDMIDVKTLLPQLSTDYLVLGKFIGSLNWNGRDKIFDALLPHNVDFCKLQNVPIHGVDPVVTIELPDDLRKLLEGNTKESTQQLRDNIKRIPEDLLKKMTTKGGIPLDPENVIYIVRPGMVGDYEGVSMLQRILPVWLIEKALIRGTLDQVWKRQRGILHAQLGGDDWEPSQNDYTAVQELILGADHDPTGAVLVTRSGVNISEIRRGDDFWRYDMISDWARGLKLQAMGISEAFISGDATISALEGAVSVSLAHFKSYRDMLTKQIFYDKVFPTIAIANNYKRRDRKSIVLGSDMSEADYRAYREERAWFDGIKYDPIDGQIYAEFAASGVNIYNTDLTQYSMPKVTWNATLDQNTDTKLNDLLKMAEEHGVPVPMRTWVAASQMTVEELIEQKESDLKTAKFFFEWRKERLKYLPTANGDPAAGANNQGEDGFGGGGDEDNDAGGGFTFASASARRPWADGRNNMPGEGSMTRVGLLNREFGDAGEVKRITHRGTEGILSREGQDMVNDRVRKNLVEATSEQLRIEHARQEAAKPEPLSKSYRAYPLRRRVAE